MSTYPKPYKSIPELLTLIQQRGMEITDIDAATRCLKRVGYYRLSGYWFPFRKSHVATGAEGSAVTVIEDDFRAGARFSDVSDLYVFDKNLRMIILDAVERVEVSLKVSIADLLGQRDPLAYINAAELHPNFSRKNKQGPTDHERWVAQYRRLEERSKEEFAKIFLDRHPGTEFPIWMAIEFWDFGALSHFISGMKFSDRQALAASYGLTREDLLRGWVRAINVVRNTCAHHSRLWNRPLIDHPSPPKQGDHLWLDHLVGDTIAQRRLYTAAAALQFLLRSVSINSSWAARLKDHCGTFPQSPHLDFRQAGFPANWQQLPLWA